MNARLHDLRKQTLDLLTAPLDDPSPLAPPLLLVAESWLAALDEADLADIPPVSLASALRRTLVHLPSCGGAGCRIITATFANSQDSTASALLILNPDMPYLVDSFVMTLRRMGIASSAVLNAVLSISRDGDGKIVRAAPARAGSDPLESFVLCLLSDTLEASALSALSTRLEQVADDAACVHRDAALLQERMTGVAALAAAGGSAEGKEASAFIEWARDGGFEPFGYAYYRALPGEHQLERDLSSRNGVLRDTTHSVYDHCLAGIPGEFNALASRTTTLSVVKADVQSTLHRDLQLDFIGVRDVDTTGTLRGEHCFIGLFTRAAAATALARLPFVRGRIEHVLTLAGVRREGFRAEKFLEILEALPRTEALEADPAWLANLCSSVVSLYKQPRSKVFARRDLYGRHLNVIVYLPRERYSAMLVATMVQEVQRLSAATEVRADTQVSEGPLARVVLIATAARADLDLESAVCQPLTDIVEGWHRQFEALVAATADSGVRRAMHLLRLALPAEYVATTPARVAYHDMLALQTPRDIGMVTVRIDAYDSASISIRLYSSDGVPPLSAMLPALHNAGVEIAREQSYQLAPVDGKIHYITSLSTDAVSAARLALPEVAVAAQELFEALFNNQAEDGRMNGLVIEAALRLREVQLVRAYVSYWRQAGCKFSLRYIADCLRKQPAQVRGLIDGFLRRFDPALESSQREEGTAALTQLRNNLADVNHADTEDILRSIADLMLATLRTSWFQTGQASDTMIFKFDASALTLLPQPRPYRELFVFARRFEGVHLRGGPVARGGLRWSDRMEDYRTEVMGLVKAQMVKNAVIVPVGAKGGFVCKMMPKNATREVIAAEGEAVYRLFIAGLLDLTDNRVRDAVIAPLQTVCYDGDDPYLVVAADKGTATFSDIANSIAIARGFWLGDAFASGGSNGYDHKKLGITAKGAWEAVKRHFYEMGHDVATTPVTAIGIGDMSGDVFGNGVLLSRHLKLIAAFDHRHIFIDPTPDCAASFAERQRMFALPRSSWEDYDRSLISPGGGVWPRSARTIPLSDEVRIALDIDALSLSPEALLHAILLAPVDLFYNGGIGTYIKASTESHDEVKDRANDLIRVDGSALRCKVVAEGGNLGATQAGRIEFALRGGRLFTDAIDNSAGVDCSDHEVNVKIWLDTEVNAGLVSTTQRNQSLFEITDDIEALVLRDNTLQTHLLVRETQAQQQAEVRDGYAALMISLEREGALSRQLDQLPSELQFTQRVASGQGLTAPELAVLIAHVKNRYKALLALQTLTTQRWARSLLLPYFPAALAAGRDVLAHPLANPILATVLANEIVNRCGPLMVGTLARLHQVSESDVVCAWAQAWAALHLAPLYQTLDAFALTIPVSVSITLDQHSRALQTAVTNGVLSMPGAQQISGAGIDELSLLFGTSAVDKLLGRSEVSHWTEDDDLPDAIVEAAQRVDAIEGVADFLFAALSVLRPSGMDLQTLLDAGIALRQQSGIDRIEHALMQMVVMPSQQALRTHALHALRHAQQLLLTRLLDTGAHDITNAIALTVQKLPLVTTSPSQDASLESVILQAWAMADAAAQIP